MDFLIKNAVIIDGSGAPAFSGDVALEGGKIAAMGSLENIQAETVINVAGKTLTPGFIDMHSHSDVLFFNGSDVPHKVMQGVTTEVVGQDGISLAPLTEFSKEAMTATLEPLAGRITTPLTALSMDGLLRSIEEKKPQLNVLTLTGHANLRQAVMGPKMARAETQDLDRMRDLLDETLRQGSYGLSMGLIYPPSSYSDTAELISLAEVVARHDGLIVSHMRDEQDHIFEALDEMIEIGRQSGARIHISHLKCMGKNNWGKMPLVLERIETARDNGVIISFDQYPYEASSTTLSLLLPPWAQEGGFAGFEKALAREGARSEILIEIEKTIERRGGAESIRIASAPAEEAAPAAGRSLAEVAKMWGVSPSEAAFRILHATRLGTTAIYHAMSLEDVERAMGHELHTVGSDGVLVGDSPHPRAAGTFPRVIHHFRKNRGLFTLEAAIHDMTGKAAQVMKLPGRGLVRAGYHADLIVFDSDEFQDHATYDDPWRLPTGLEWVFINGRPVVEEGEIQNVRSGRILRPNDPM